MRGGQCFAHVRKQSPVERSATYESEIKTAQNLHLHRENLIPANKDVTPVLSTWRAEYGTSANDGLGGGAAHTHR